jgi:hypothetical protein
MRKIRAVCAPLSVVLLISSLSLAEDPVEHTELGFSLRLPAGFERVSEEEKSDVVRVYRQTSAEGPLAIVVAIERLRGVLPRVDIEKAPVNPNVQFSTERWNGFDILVGRVAEDLQGNPAVVLNAQVPLRPEAIQLKLIGPLSEETRLRGLLRDLLSTLQGSTNWLTDDERTQRLHEGTKRLAITLAIVAVIAVLLARGIKKLRGSTAR